MNNQEKYKQIEGAFLQSIKMLTDFADTTGCRVMGTLILHHKSSNNTYIRSVDSEDKKLF